MKFKICFAIVLFSQCCSNLLLAQSSNFSAGEELYEAKGTVSLALNNQDVVFIANDVGTGYSEGMDVSMYRMKSGDLSTTLKKTTLNSFSFKERDFEKVFSIGDKQYIFYTNKAKGNGELMLSYQIIENSSLKPSPVKDISLGIKTWGKSKKTATTYAVLYDDDDYIYNFEVILMNKNKDKFLYIDHLQDKEKGRVSRVVVIDAQTMKIEKETTFDIGISKFGANGVYHNDFLYSLVQVYPGDDADENNHFQLIGLSLKKGVESFGYDLKFEGKTIETCAFDVAPNGEVLISGVFSNIAKKHTESIVDGVFFHRLDGITGKKLSESDTKLDLKTIQFLTGKPNSQKVEKIETRFESIKFYSLANGTTNVIMEDTRLTSGPIVSSTLLAFNINKNGDFSWIKHIPKKQENEDFSQKYTGYSYHLDGNKLSLVYMDNKNNYDSKTSMLLPDKMLSIKNVKTATKNSNGMAMVTIDENGTIEHKLLADTGGYSCFSQDAVWNKSGDEIYIVTIKKTFLLNVSKIKVK
jgi:hypothetical protein